MVDKTIRVLNTADVIVTIDGRDYIRFDSIRADVDSPTQDRGRIDFIKDSAVVASSQLDVMRGRVTPRDMVVLVSRVNGLLLMPEYVEVGND